MTCRSEHWTIPLSERESKGSRRKGGHLSPPDRLCHFCNCPMPPAQAVEACVDCLGVWKRISLILSQVHQVYEITRTMARDEVFRVLWEFKWKNRGIK